MYNEKNVVVFNSKTMKTIKIILTIVSLTFLTIYLYMFVDFRESQISTDNLILTNSEKIPKKSDTLHDSTYKNTIIVKDGEFVFKDGRKAFLRGINLSGSSKMPFSPKTYSHVYDNFFDGSGVSFVGRPFPLNEAELHFKRLSKWGFHFIRFIITWEALEHKAPGVIDYEYIRYIKEIVTVAEKYNINIMIDPHQDLWGRFSGGDGAPLWTYEVAGFNVKNFKETGAALVHNTHGDPFPKMQWFSNYYKLSTATMFTLFWGGNAFAPDLKIDDQNIQHFMQSCYINAISELANELKGCKNVVGFEVMNEPSSGYIGIKDISKQWETDVIGECPTPLQGMMLGDGISQKIEINSLGSFGVNKESPMIKNKNKVSAWNSKNGCIWKQHGVWSDNNGKSPIVKKEYFNSIDGRKVNFNKDFYTPFIKKFTNAIKSINNDWFTCVNNTLFPYPLKIPNLKTEDNNTYVNGSHWYDDATLVTKEYRPWIGLINEKIILGKRSVRKAIDKYMSDMKSETEQYYGKAPTLLGEFGIPMDINNKNAFRTNDFSDQEKALQRCFNAIENNLLHYTLWNYTPDNNNNRGDNWNGEDLSVFSISQKENNDINSGGRALNVVIRPYPIKIPGKLIHYKFYPDDKTLEIVFDADDNKLPLEVFIPKYHYSENFMVYSTTGNLTFNKYKNSLNYYHSNNKRNTIIIKLVNS